MSQYFPPYNNPSKNIKVELDLSNYATKKDINDITHVDVTGFVSKTNLAALKTGVDKIDADKLKTVPVDLAKLSNVVKNEVVKKTDYNAKVTNIESRIAGVTKNTVDNLADITKLKAVDTNNFVLKTKLASDVTTLENKIDIVDKKIPDISGLATKNSLSDYLQTSTFISKVTEVENKIQSADIIAKSANSKANTIRSDLTGYAKKADVATDITSIKNNYVTNVNLTSQLNNLKSQHITDEVKKIEDKVNENKKEITFVRGFYSYEHNSDLVYDCKLNSFKILSYGISRWKSKNIYDPSIKNVLYPVRNIKLLSPNIKNDSKGLHVFFNGGSYLHQDIIAIPNNVINIYCVYELDPTDLSRNNEFTIQNALFGAIEITKNANTSKYKYKGYGICFDESEEFTHVQKEGNFNHTTSARNLIIFGADMSFSKHANNKANNIYVMGKDYIQKINDTTIYAEKMFYGNFTDPGHKFILSLHYNGNDSYLFVNGREELKFKTKADLKINNQLCLGNLSFDWTKDESKTTSLYGNIYDFVVDYKAIVGTTTIYDMHQYLMTKHNIIT